MKKILLFCLSLTFIHVSAFALKENEIVASMQQKIDNATVILQKKDADISTKASLIFAQLDSVFDYKLMGRLSLGRVWSTLEVSQQEEFVKLFEGYMKKSYIDKLELYTNEKVSVQEAKKEQENRLWLYTKLLGEKESFDIIYKFYKNAQEDWLIYDVDIIGVSIIKTYRAQFEDIINTSSFATLLEKIKNTQ